MNAIKLLSKNKMPYKRQTFKKVCKMLYKRNKILSSDLHTPMNS